MQYVVRQAGTAGGDAGLSKRSGPRRTSQRRPILPRKQSSDQHTSAMGKSHYCRGCAENAPLRYFPGSHSRLARHWRAALPGDLDGSGCKKFRDSGDQREPVMERMERPPVCLGRRGVHV